MGAGGGWSWVLSDLKTLLETGASMDPHDELNQADDPGHGGGPGDGASTVPRTLVGQRKGT